MKPRALILFGVLFVPPAWAQQTAFDLGNESIKKIVRDTAAAHSVPVRISEPAAATAESAESADTITYVPPEKPPVVKVATPRLPEPVPESNGPISALIDMLLGHDDDPPEAQHDKWLQCRWRDSVVPPASGSESCPAIAGDPVPPRITHE